MKITTLIAAVTAGFSCALAAQTERDLESHEHGHALLNIAIDSELLFIELDTPWNNLVGFEHKPGDSEEQSLVNNALANLKDPEKLFDFEGAPCKVVETMVENSASDEEQDTDKKEHGDEHADDGETHNEVRVTYSFECDNINKLEAISVKFFELWPGFEELDAQLIGPSGQAAAELTPDAVRLDVTQIQ